MDPFRVPAEHPAAVLAQRLNKIGLLHVNDGSDVAGTTCFTDSKMHEADLSAALRVFQASGLSLCSPDNQFVLPLVNSKSYPVQAGQAYYVKVRLCLSVSVCLCVCLSLSLCLTKKPTPSLLG